jgi:hypothetical protein
VRGNTLQIGCNHVGKISIEKKVPANRNCGSVNKFANGGIELSFFARLLTTKPNPIKTTRAKKLKTSISRKVTKPFTNV